MQEAALRMYCMFYNAESGGMVGCTWCAFMAVYACFMSIPSLIFLIVSQARFLSNIPGATCSISLNASLRHMVYGTSLGFRV
jgi:hypothetical protein